VRKIRHSSGPPGGSKALLGSIRGMLVGAGISTFLKWLQMFLQYSACYSSGRQVIACLPEQTRQLIVDNATMQIELESKRRGKAKRAPWRANGSARRVARHKRPARRPVGAVCVSGVRHQPSIADPPMRHGDALVTPKSDVILNPRDARQRLTTFWIGSSAGRRAYLIRRRGGPQGDDTSACCVPGASRRLDSSVPPLRHLPLNG
jgi:hypothetical protein